MSTRVPITFIDTHTRGSGFQKYYLNWRDAALKQAISEGRFFELKDELAKIGATFVDGDIHISSSSIYLEFEDASAAAMFLLKWS